LWNFWFFGTTGVMNTRSAVLGILFFCILVFVEGCGKRDLQNKRSASPTVLASSPDSVIRVHWRGRKHLDLDADAYYVSRIWSLPESKQLQQQTCDKLATNFLRGALGDTAVPIPPQVLRPMFDEIALQECYFEFRESTNSPTPNWCFAIHAGERRAGPWATNLVLVSEMSLGASPSLEPKIHGWTIQGTNVNKRIMVSRIKDWVIISLGAQKNPLFEEVAEGLFRGDGVCLTSESTNCWIEAEIDLNRVARTVPAATDLPRVAFTVTGDGSRVITEGRLTFSKDLSSYEPWCVPTNIIHCPLLNFTAVRGLRPLFGQWQIWDDLQTKSPDQLLLWSLDGNPYQAYMAATSSDAREDVSKISSFLLGKGNSWLGSNGYIGFHSAADGNGVIWGNVQSLTPFIKTLELGTHSWLYGGLLMDPGRGTNAPLSGEILRNLDATNLLYYNWELTGQSLSSRLSLLQTARQIARKPEISTESLSMAWLAALRERLGASETRLTRTGPKELTLSRKSTIGFTALELHLLADWLESPDFPRGTRSHWGINETTH
jgi:hypothetical protein